MHPFSWPRLECRITQTRAVLPLSNLVMLPFERKSKRNTRAPLSISPQLAHITEHSPSPCLAILLRGVGVIFPLELWIRFSWSGRRGCLPVRSSIITHLARLQSHLNCYVDWRAGRARIGIKWDTHDIRQTCDGVGVGKVHGNIKGDQEAV